MSTKPEIQKVKNKKREILEILKNCPAVSLMRCSRALVGRLHTLG